MEHQGRHRHRNEIQKNGGIRIYHDDDTGVFFLEIFANREAHRHQVPNQVFRLLAWAAS